MNCEIIGVGTELLLGDIVNTDAQFLARELASMGVVIHYQEVVGDNPERMRSCISTAVSRSDLVVLTGGLGPTADDLTKEICCEVMGAELVLDEEILAGIRGYFESKGITMPESNAKQAYVPKDGTVFRNRNGTAPGCAIEKDGKTVVMLPGPPRELKPMFENEVKPFLLRKTGGVILSKQVRTFGIGESDMAQRVSELLDGANPTVAPYAKDGEALLRVTARAETDEKALEMCEAVIVKIREKIGEYIYSEDSLNLEQTAVKLLGLSGKKVAVAESCTGGYLAKRITDVSGSSAVFECGVVSYANVVKQNLLGVKAETLDKYTEISEETAAEMAQGVRRLSGADIGIGITGSAGPQAAREDKPVGLIYVAISHEGDTKVRKLMTGKKEDSREYNRYVAASNALHMIIQYLKGRDDER